MLSDAIVPIFVIFLCTAVFVVMFIKLHNDSQINSECQELTAPYQFKIMSGDECFRLADNGTDWIFIGELPLEE